MTVVTLSVLGLRQTVHCPQSKPKHVSRCLIHIWALTYHISHITGQVASLALLGTPIQHSNSAFHEVTKLELHLLCSRNCLLCLLALLYA